MLSNLSYKQNWIVSDFMQSVLSSFILWNQYKVALFYKVHQFLGSQQVARISNQCISAEVHIKHMVQYSCINEFGKCIK